MSLENAKMKSLKDKIALSEAPVEAEDEERVVEKVKRVIKRVTKKK